MIVIYHNNCWDGFGAAWAAWVKYPDAKFIPANYGDQPPDVTGEDVIIADYSYTRIGPDSEKGLIMDEMASKAKSFRVFDHHKTAQEALRNKPYAVFDMTRSGAVITWDELIKGDRALGGVPLLLEYVQDRDLWTWKLPHSKEISAWIGSFEREFWTWNQMSDNLDSNFYDCVNQGTAILRFQGQRVKETCENVIWRAIGGYNVPTVNSAQFMSEVGEFLCEKFPDAPFAAYYFDREDGLRQWGLRSRGNFDVSEVAKSLGGGGHRNAAGFQTKIKG